MTDVILASGSTTRERLLREAGVSFSVEIPNVDEIAVLESLVAEGASAREAADVLAELKAVKVSVRHPTAFVIGADQILSMERSFFRKPADLGAAREQLKALRGRTHVLTSAVVAARGGSGVWRDVREARLTMRPFSDAFLEDYLAHAGADIPGSVGAYRVEGLGVQFFSRIEGDHFTIQGLPLISLLDFLRMHGVVKE